MHLTGNLIQNIAKWFGLCLQQETPCGCVQSRHEAGLGGVIRGDKGSAEIAFARDIDDDPVHDMNVWPFALELDLQEVRR